MPVRLNTHLPVEGGEACPTVADVKPPGAKRRGLPKGKAPKGFSLVNPKSVEVRIRRYRLGYSLSDGVDEAGTGSNR
jgi:hypothetical protein